MSLLELGNLGVYPTILLTTTPNVEMYPFRLGIHKNRRKKETSTSCFNLFVVSLSFPTLRSLTWLSCYRLVKLRETLGR